VRDVRTETSQAQAAAAGRPGQQASWPAALVKTARPRQWTKNLLVFAAPLAGGSLGKGSSIVDAAAAFAAFVLASSAVYLVNDVVDADRDKLHPVKRYRPIAAGHLSKGRALAASAVCALAALAAGLLIGAPGLTLIIAIYLCESVLYSIRLKQVPFMELVLVASGFTLRALGGALATHVPPSGWFLTVCSLGALLVAVAKRSCELRLLGPERSSHRPVLRFYSPRGLGLAQRVLMAAMLVAYVFWALGDRTDWMRAWHLASVLPLAAALVRFDWLAARPTAKPVEDLISRDVPMLWCEAAWLALFVVGL
jgi:decaprenyl-phosphate phosphoribosyltransferase